MSVSNQNFTIYAGDTVAINLVINDAEGLPLNLDGVTLYWGLGPVNVEPATLVKTSVDEIEIVGAGQATVHLTPADTVNMRGQFRQEVRMIDLLGNIETLLTGIVTIQPTSLRPALPGRMRLVSGVA